MSSRIYPLYRLGNPQLRIFLPNFWMKLVQVEHLKQPKNQVSFIVSSEMTSLDVKNYLEKIYDVPVMDVKTANYQGKSHYQSKLGFIWKEDDYKVAYVTLENSHEFEFPDVVKASSLEEKEAKANSDLDEAKRTFDRQVKTHRQPGRKGLPSFFGL